MRHSFIIISFLLAAGGLYSGTYIATGATETNYSNSIDRLPATAIAATRPAALFDAHATQYAIGNATAATALDSSAQYKGLELQRNESLGSLIRNSIIFGSLFLGGATAWLIGDSMYQQANTHYQEYTTSFDSYSLEMLHDRIISLGDSADVLYTIGECSVILSAVFLVWGIVDYCYFLSYDTRLERLRANVTIHPDGVGLHVSYRF